MRKLSLFAVVAGLSAQAFAAASQVPLATPPGITFQVTRGGMIYGDANGKSLYTSDAEQMGVAACTGDCAKAWMPVAAPTDAKPMGDWTLAARNDGVKQWAFKGKPLYTSAKDEKPSDVKGTVEGWHVAAFQPSAPALLPPDIAVREAAALPGQILVNADSHSLYTGPLDCTGRCAESWMPVAAPAVAGTSGDFTAIKRRDGMRQWAYKGAPLYSFAGDVGVGDLAGRGVDARFQVAALSSYFMPAGVSIRSNPEDLIHPELLTAANGRTLYAREHWAYTQTFHAKDGDRGTPDAGRAIGTSGCSGACLTRWEPLVAPDNAVASGNWSVMTRENGVHQWAYQGYALYTYKGDEKAGDTRGNEMFDLWEKDLIGMPQVAGATATASVMFWRAAGP